MRCVPSAPSQSPANSAEPRVVAGRSTLHRRYHGRPPSPTTAEPRPRTAAEAAAAAAEQHRGTAEAGDYSLRALMHEACLVHHLQRLKRQRVGYEELMMVHDWRPLEQLGFSRPESQRLLAALEKARGPQLPASPPLAQARSSLRQPALPL